MASSAFRSFTTPSAWRGMSALSRTHPTRRYATTTTVATGRADNSVGFGASPKSPAEYAAAWPSAAVAAVYEKHGAPEDMLRVVDLPLASLSSLGEDQVAVKMLAAPINPSDINQVQGTYAVKPPLPAVGGNEGVGMVVAVGPKAQSRLRPGQWVIPRSSGQGTWRSHWIAKESQFLVIPNDLALSQAATISVNPCTAWRMLHDFVPLQAGDTVIQNGANSAVGLCVIQLARALKLNTVNVVRDREDISALEGELVARGATHVVTDKFLGSFKMAEFWKQHSASLCPPRLGFNMVGGPNATNVIRQLGNRGVLVTYGGMSREPVVAPTGPFIFNDLQLRGFWMTRWNDEHAPEERERMLQDIAVHIRSGTLSTSCQGRPLAEFAGALTASRTALQAATFKQVLTMV
ncbi:trans-2-enoyl-CoA reductase [Capsaspora owczarzaki ATCC 30864]|uniref:Enoyl-[acyl-carrier-protein] reductase, mitochondrial n=1 Tax=Capsaspora owczarzaki (strain ATCC 30864) TaxID=595528 RepID=A0A0D2X0C9_CAPO3|nr:trans-2-enoyl-CoA reductase [Capsaspora owczarzaki ATCC 30864]KJE88839.1 trans-2-enoyl-CoA reductase [Capsaspora owczarzaki ATCC 30864]|eukprot:XP_004365289.1 trans-2-enoyl-CoA reductase [Capsaspora owczarzaki ATCC 30864]